MKRILVARAGEHLAVSFTRALRAGSEPLHLVGLDSDEFALQRAEVEERRLVPRVEEEDYIPILCGIIRETRPDLLCVLTGKEMLSISAARERLDVCTFLPRHETLRLLESRADSYERCRQAGVPVPRSVLINNEADLRRAFTDVGEHLWLRNVEAFWCQSSLTVSDLDMARAWIDLFGIWGSCIAVEPLLRNTVVWESVWSGGELVAAQGTKRLYWEFARVTPSGVSGITGAGETVANAQVDEMALQAIKAIDPRPNGIFSVDLAYDQHGGLMVTEVNSGGFTSGSVAVYAAGGVNMPYISVKVALGEMQDLPAPLVNPSPEGVVSVHGMDIEPVITNMGYINRFEEELRSRRMSVRSGAGTSSADPRLARDSASAE